MTAEITPAKVRLSDQLGHADEAQPQAWEHLKAHGYAPGGYMGRCRKCGDERIDMDKRAITCRACAERMHGVAMVAAAVAAERERCASLCDLHSRLTWNDDRKAQSRVLAAEIRRGA